MHSHKQTSDGREDVQQHNNLGPATEQKEIQCFPGETFFCEKS
jgi:hypothetical protein